MTTKVAIVDPRRPDSAVISEAASVIRAGGLVAFPTETVYGLGADAMNAKAVARIFEAKGRPATNPLIVHIADVDMARGLAAEWPDYADRLAVALWPGPLTLIVRRGDRVPPIVTAGGSTVALRMPAHPVARALIEAAGCPVAAPSANRSSRISPTLAQHVLETLNGRIDMILDGGPTTGGIESTVLDLTATPPRILRPGLVSPQQIEAIIGSVALPTRPASETLAPVRSPGMSKRHYAPRAPLECFADAAEHVARARGAGERVGWVRLGPTSASPVADELTVSMPDTPREYAAKLYAVLHEMDRAGVARIIVDALPDTDEWMAIRDRLARAAAPPAQSETHGK